MFCIFQKVQVLPVSFWPPRDHSLLCWATYLPQQHLSRFCTNCSFTRPQQISSMGCCVLALQLISIFGWFPMLSNLFSSTVVGNGHKRRMRGATMQGEPWDRAGGREMRSRHCCPCRDLHVLSVELFLLSSSPPTRKCSLVIVYYSASDRESNSLLLGYNYRQLAFSNIMTSQCETVKITS